MVYLYSRIVSSQSLCDLPVKMSLPFWFANIFFSLLCIPNFYLSLSGINLNTQVLILAPCTECYPLWLGSWYVQLQMTDHQVVSGFIMAEYCISYMIFIFKGLAIFGKGKKKHKEMFVGSHEKTNTPFHFFCMQDIDNSQLVPKSLSNSAGTCVFFL